MKLFFSIFNFFLIGTMSFNILSIKGEGSQLSTKGKETPTAQSKFQLPLSTALYENIQALRAFIQPKTCTTPSNIENVLRGLNYVTKKNKSQVPSGTAPCLVLFYQRLVGAPSSDFNITFDHFSKTISPNFRQIVVGLLRNILAEQVTIKELPPQETKAAGKNKEIQLVMNLKNIDLKTYTSEPLTTGPLRNHVVTLQAATDLLNQLIVPTTVATNFVSAEKRKDLYQKWEEMVRKTGKSQLIYAVYAGKNGSRTHKFEKESKKMHHQLRRTNSTTALDSLTLPEQEIKKLHKEFEDEHSRILIEKIEKMSDSIEKLIPAAEALVHKSNRFKPKPKKKKWFSSKP